VNVAELERYLHEHIPLSRAMGVAVAAATLDEVVLTAPFAPNINHRETVFGGSASALCILSAWALVHLRLRAAGVAARLVIQRNVMDYQRPIQGEFSARATIPDAAAWSRFERAFERKGRGRIDVAATLASGDEIAGRLAGTFVALR